MDIYISQAITDSLVYSGFYILLAIGLALVLGVCDILNLAHGEIYMVASFITYYVATVAGLNYVVALVLAVGGAALIGVIIEKYLLRRFRGNHIPAMIVGVGFVLALPAAGLLVFGELARGVKSPFPQVLTAFGATLPLERLIVIIVALAMVGGLAYFIYRTKAGRAIRAVAQNPVAASLQGIDINRYSTIGMAIGSGLAGAAAALMAPVFLVEFSMGMHALFNALIVITIGGMRSLLGAVVGGLILGFINGMVLTYVGHIAYVIGFIALIIVLLARPAGLFGQPLET